MTRDDPPLPTRAELAVLEVLWHRGPSTVREVADRLRGRRPAGYTTILKLLQILFDKGLVTRRADGPRHVYAAAHRAAETRGRLLDDLLERAFAGSAKGLVLEALAGGRASPAELEEIRCWLGERLDAGDRGGGEEDER